LQTQVSSKSTVLLNDFQQRLSTTITEAVTAFKTKQIRSKILKKDFPIFVIEPQGNDLVIVRPNIEYSARLTKDFLITKQTVLTQFFQNLKEVYVYSLHGLSLFMSSTRIIQ
jgi:hypothetical protein